MSSDGRNKGLSQGIALGFIVGVLTVFLVRSRASMEAGQTARFRVEQASRGIPH